MQQLKCLRHIDPHGHMHRKRASSVGSKAADHLGAIGEEGTQEDDSDTETIASNNTTGNQPRDYLSPLWIQDDILKRGEIEHLTQQEEMFWNDLIEKYLYPIDEDKAEKVLLRQNHEEDCEKYNLQIVL